jgi:hypothetical protein
MLSRNTKGAENERSSLVQKFQGNIGTVVDTSPTHKSREIATKYISYNKTN